MLTFLVVSSIFSATKYTSRLFSALGMPTYHEYGVLTPKELKTPVPEYPAAAGSLCVGNCSWPLGFKAAHFKTLDSAVPVFHQVREPLATLNTIMRNNRAEYVKMKGNAIVDKLAAWVTANNVFEDNTPGPSLKNACNLWCKWHKLLMSSLCTNNYHRFCIERAGVGLVSEIRQVMELPSLTDDHIYGVLRQLPTNIHHHSGDPAVSSTYSPATWSTVTEEVRELASFFGYRPNKYDEYRLELDVSFPVLSTSFS